MRLINTRTPRTIDPGTTLCLALAGLPHGQATLPGGETLCQNLFLPFQRQELIWQRLRRLHLPQYRGAILSVYPHDPQPRVHNPNNSQMSHSSRSRSENLRLGKIRSSLPRLGNPRNSSLTTRPNLPQNQAPIISGVTMAIRGLIPSTHGSTRRSIPKFEQPGGKNSSVVAGESESCPRE